MSDDSRLLSPDHLPEETSAVRRCVDSIRRMILQRTLLPGEQIRQAEMAERLNVSRVPLREALKVLETERVLQHRPNRGYFVARLRSSDLSQIYLMRRLLEDELFQAIEWPDQDQIASLREVNAQMREAIEGRAIDRLVTTNRAFHFAIFGMSPHHMVRREVERLWALSDSYRAIYLYASAPRERVLSEHELIIGALERRDREALIALSDQHRIGLQTHMSALLEPDRRDTVDASDPNGER